jgi:NADH-quinone oxidoreductase subunit M
MDLSGIPVLSIIAFLPFVGAVLIALLPGRKEGAVRAASLIVSIATFVISLPLYFLYDSDAGTIQFTEVHSWIPSFGIAYRLGIDGISLLLLLLTTFISPIVLLSSYGHIKERVKEFNVLYLLMETGMVGVFVATDLFLFYIFWELTLIPLYFIVGIWGGPRRLYAAIKFFLYTLVGSLLMLVAIIYLMLLTRDQTGEPSSSLFFILNNVAIPETTQMWLFAAFALAFAIKIPLFPFHTWLPDAHVEAPTAGSVILAGVLLKLGTYGLIRFCLPLFPWAMDRFTPLFLVLAAIGIIYGAFLAWAQEDLKKLVAYSSISHMGFIVLGIFAWNLRGIQGGILQSVNHGLSTGALFLLVGMIYDRRHVRMISDFGGLGRVIPWFSVALIIVTLSSIGLPGLNGFVGEILIIQGMFEADWRFAIPAAFGILLGAIYMLSMVRRTVMGPPENEANKDLKDLNKREVCCLLPIIVLIFVIGFFPGLFLDKTENSVKKNVLEYRDRIHISQQQ